MFFAGNLKLAANMPVWRRLKKLETRMLKFIWRWKQIQEDSAPRGCLACHEDILKIAIATVYHSWKHMETLHNKHQ